MKKLQTLALSALALSISSAAMAGDIVGAQSAASSDDYYIEIGKSTVPFGPHTKGLAGIGSSNSIFGAGSKVDFQGLTGSSKVTPDKIGNAIVYNFDNSITKPSKWWNFHRKLGDFNFMRAGTGDVWFGEWSKSGADGNYAHRQVYYVGDKSGATLGTGVAQYTAYGINKFVKNENSHNLMTGTLTANFGDSTLTGNLTRTGDILSIDADISSGDASFAGTATFNSVGGESKGQFFGAGASSLAGIAEFTNTDYNTAFGGIKKTGQ